MSVYKAIAAVMADLSRLGLSKDKKNSQQGFMYRGVDDAMNVLSPLLSKHGLLILPRVTKREVIERQSKSGGALFYVTLDMEFDFVSAEDGSKHTVGPLIGEAMDSGDKASNKAMSIAYKYACFQSFCIPTEGDNDPDATTHDVESQKWDGRKLVGYSTLKEIAWRDASNDFLLWTDSNRVPPEIKEGVRRERARRQAEADSLHTSGRQ
jgi:hypothetical protein